MIDLIGIFCFRSHCNNLFAERIDFLSNAFVTFAVDCKGHA